VNIWKPDYSGDPKTGHLNTGNIRKPDVFSSDFRIAKAFENRTNSSGFQMVASLDRFYKEKSHNKYFINDKTV
jgi:hypothetical protein